MKKKKYDFTVIGAGPMGLYLSYLLSKNNYKVRLIDSNKKAGGHARPIKFCGSKIEIFYHFFYKNDEVRALKWINSVKGANEIVWKKINTDIIYVNKNKFFINPDNFFEILKFLKIEFIQLIIGVLKIKFLKNSCHLRFQKAVIWANKTFGKKFASLVWIPLLKGKFGKSWNKISALWLFSRVKTHLSTKTLFDRKSIFGYLQHTYEPTINKTLNLLKKKKSIFILNKAIKNITIKKNKIINLKINNKILKIHEDEKVVSTIPLFALKKLFHNKNQLNYLKKFNGIGVVVCILMIKKKLSNSYWTSVSDPSSPFNAIIQQNRLYSKSKYEIVYTSKYVEAGSLFFKKNKKIIINSTIQYIINTFPHISKKDIIKTSVFKSLSAAPIPTIGTITKIPDFKSPIENFWHGGLEYIYPEDRGLSNSIEISEKLFNELR